MHVPEWTPWIMSGSLHVAAPSPLSLGNTHSLSHDGHSFINVSASRSCHLNDSCHLSDLTLLSMTFPLSATLALLAALLFWEPSSTPTWPLGSGRPLDPRTLSGSPLLGTLVHTTRPLGSGRPLSVTLALLAVLLFWQPSSTPTWPLGSGRPLSATPTWPLGSGRPLLP